MQKIFNAISASAALLLSCVSLQAAAQVAPVPAPAPAPAPGPAFAPPASIPSDDSTDYEGDRVVFPLDITNAHYDDGANNGEGTPVCIPGGTMLRGLHDVDKTTLRFQVNNDDASQKQPECPKPQMTPAIREHVAIVIPNRAETLLKNRPDRYGLTYGALIVPFKAQLTGNKDITGGSSVGGYIGRKIAKSTLGAELDLIAFLGLTSVPVAQTAAGQNTSQNLEGMSAGFGVIGTIKDSFHLGVVLGWDHVGSAAGYQYNNKPWIAAQFGVEFSH